MFTFNYYYGFEEINKIKLYQSYIIFISDNYFQVITPKAFKYSTFLFLSFRINCIYKFAARLFLNNFKCLFMYISSHSIYVFFVIFTLIFFAYYLPLYLIIRLVYFTVLGLFLVYLLLGCIILPLLSLLYCLSYISLISSFLSILVIFHIYCCNP